MKDGNQFMGYKLVLPRKNLLITLAMVGCLDGCAGNDPKNLRDDAQLVSQPQGVKDQALKNDPYETFNRAMFKFNDHVDSYVAKPISDAYLWATPVFVTTGVSNFFNNLKDINVVLNDGLQGKFGQSAEDTGRFLTNSTLGLFGLFDIASKIGLPKHDEDFGQTLAIWGVPQGPYLVLPILGPTTARGVPGSVFDVAANPTSYVGAPVQLLSMLNTRASAEGALKFIDEAAIDPYVFTREAYLQNQQYMISDGAFKANVDVLPLEDDLFTEGNTGANKSANVDGAVSSLERENQRMEAFTKKLDEMDLKRHKKSFKHKHHRKLLTVVSE